MHYKGPLDVASKVWATEGGLRGIYKGLVPTLAREVPGNALMFGAYEALKRKARDLQVQHSGRQSIEGRELLMFCLPMETSRAKEDLMYSMLCRVLR